MRFYIFNTRAAARVECALPVSISNAIVASEAAKEYGETYLLSHMVRAGLFDPWFEEGRGAVPGAEHHDQQEQVFMIVASPADGSVKAVPMEACALEEEVEFKSALAGGRFRTLSRSHRRKLGMAYGQKPTPELPALEAQTEEVKSPYKQKHGEDVDEEQLVD